MQDMEASMVALRLSKHSSEVVHRPQVQVMVEVVHWPQVQVMVVMRK